MTLHAKMAIPCSELDINVYNSDYFQLGVFYKSYLRISTAEKHIGTIRIKHFWTYKKDHMSFIIDQIKIKDTVVNRVL